MFDENTQSRRQWRVHINKTSTILQEKRHSHKVRCHICTQKKWFIQAKMTYTRNDERFDVN